MPIHSRIAAALLVLIAPGAAISQQRDHNEIVLVPDGDRHMEQAIAKARATLDSFLEISKAPPPGASGFRLKVKVVDGKQVEHFWVSPFRAEGIHFAGVLANEPRLVKNVKGGDVIRFGRNEITDWGYVKDGKQVGSFTVCAMFKTAPQEQIDYYRKNYGFDCNT